MKILTNHMSTNILTLAATHKCESQCNKLSKYEDKQVATSNAVIDEIRISVKRNNKIFSSN